MLLNNNHYLHQNHPMDLHIIVSHKVVSICRPRHLHVMTLGRGKVEPAESKTGEKIAQNLSSERKPANIVEGHAGDRKSNLRMEKTEH